MNVEDLTDDQLEAVSGGVPRISGGITYRLPANCPACGAELMRTRNATSTECLSCSARVEAVRVGGSPT